MADTLTRRASAFRVLNISPMAQQEHFEFVKSLAEELNRKEIKLISFPDVVLRVRKALDHPDTTSENLAMILSVDPALASRILILANSTHYNAAGIRIESLDAAVGRIGFTTVRSTAISFAIEQLHAAKPRGIKIRAATILEGDLAPGCDVRSDGAIL